jgi:hypothetical protein
VIIIAEAETDETIDKFGTSIFSKKQQGKS